MREEYHGKHQRHREEHHRPQGHRTGAGRCGVTGKAGFRTEAAARGRADQILEQPGNRDLPNRAEAFRPYKCNYCGLWHLSTKFGNSRPSSAEPRAAAKLQCERLAGEYETNAIGASSAEAARLKSDAAALRYAAKLLGKSSLPTQPQPTTTQVHV